MRYSIKCNSLTRGELMKFATHEDAICHLMPRITIFAHERYLNGSKSLNHYYVELKTEVISKLVDTKEVV